MLSSYEELDLEESAVIEASAGTGKTYSLVHLVLRYLTEGKQALQPKQLLIVTFTNAAAAELKTRLRQLVKQQLIKAEQEDHQNRLARLRSIDATLDEATIGTIHHFCQKVLKSYSFENKGLTINTLSNDTKSIEELIRDFLRKNTFFSNTQHKEQPTEPQRYSLMQQATLAFALMDGYKMEDMVKRLARLLDNHLVLQWPTLEEQTTIIEAMQEFDRGEGLWQQTYQTFLTLIPNIAPLFNKIKKYNSKIASLLNSCESLTPLLDSYSLLQLIDSKVAEDLEKFEKYSDNTAALSLQEQEQLNAILVFIQQLRPLLYNDEEGVAPYLAALRAYFLRSIIPPLQMTMATRQAQKGQFTFNSLIIKVHQLVTAPASSLLAILRSRYQVALIDEFQDTDLLQWQIFNTIFSSKNHRLVLIGDPKQAIYSFRGANNATYHHAINTIKKNRCTLTTSYRSSSAVVAATNAWFSKLYQQQPLINYTSLATLPQPPLVEPSGMIFIDLGDDTNKPLGFEEARNCTMQAFAKKIAQLLQNKTMIQDRNGQQRPLQNSDIAVLCRKNEEAKKMKSVLNAFNIASVLYKSQSIFATEEAQWLLLFLEVLTLEHEEELARTLLLTPCYGYQAEQLQQADLSNYFSKLNFYRQLAKNNQWPRLFSLLMSDSRYFINLLASQDEQRERKYVNVCHLFDIIVALSRPNACSAHHLYRQFKRLVDQQHSEIDESSIRLERDDQAVHLQTIHGSKGLEYPIVFLLDGLSNLPPHRDDFYLINKEGETLLDLTKKNQHRLALEQATLDDELNLFYVGITRAIAQIYLPLGVMKKSLYSDFLAVLTKNQESDSAQMYQDIKIFINDNKERGFSLEPLLTQEIEALKLAFMPKQTLTLATMYRYRDFYNEQEKTSSYSQLWQQQEQLGLVDDSFNEAKEADDNDAEHPLDLSATLTPLTMKGGADVGQLLHYCFENIEFTLANQSFAQFSLDTEVLTILEKGALQFVTKQWWTKHKELVLQMLWHSLNQPINSLGGLQLALLSPSCYKAELEFLIPISTNSILTLPAGRYQLQKGYIKGFIDLVFIYNGLYYILDWKTTNLGDSYSNYKVEALPQAMQEHGYQLQYYLYLYALERYGQSLDRHFNYQEHMGGVVYCFNRAALATHCDDTAFFVDKPSLASYRTFIKEQL